ncbi:hypothetical protein IAR55_005476 [Kwoniella newhampshirensis]|uniref:Uncharacterized protein n=1 Tax=Kwoniella newhampshirensis TaxID=1651941 RepID=A0AAW0YW97_9TREE
MQSASQVLPHECLLWSPQTMSSSGSNEEKSWDAVEEQKSLCLSPQDWAQLCHALNGQQQTDLARQLYTNATVEKIALLQVMKQREEAQADRDVKFMTKMEEREASSVSLGQTRDSLREGLRSFEEMTVDLRRTIDTLEVGKEALWKRLGEDLQEQTGQAAARLEATLGVVGDAWVQQAVLAEAEGRSVALREFGISEMMLQTFGNEVDRMQDMMKESLHTASNLSSMQQETSVHMAMNAMRAEILTQKLSQAEIALNNTFELLEGRRGWLRKVSLFSVLKISGQLVCSLISAMFCLFVALRTRLRKPIAIALDTVGRDGRDVEARQRR